VGPHLHGPGTAELLVFIAELIVAGFILRALAVALTTLGKPWADRLAGAIGFVF
jgi:archaellum component FlaG (FlaF/FlaG flagellin family)